MVVAVSIYTIVLAAGMHAATHPDGEEWWNAREERVEAVFNDFASSSLPFAIATAAYVSVAGFWFLFTALGTALGLLEGRRMEE